MSHKGWTYFWMGISFVFGVYVGTFGERKSLTEAAIKHGCAERVMTDSVTGETEFRWRERE